MNARAVRGAHRAVRRVGLMLTALLMCMGGTVEPARAQESLDATMEALTTIRDSFVAKAKAAGLKCGVEPPKIVLTDIASFGNYDEDTNTVQNPAWTQLSDDERQVFFRLAGPGSDDLAAQRTFERGVHHWVFVHELGHWTQKCAGTLKSGGHYATEYGANRIAAAYWREENPSLMARLATSFQQMLDGRPSPVPAGQAVEDYFNAHYSELTKTPVYTWFEAKMVSDVNAETPQPTFAQVLSGSNLKR